MLLNDTHARMVLQCLSESAILMVPNRMLTIYIRTVGMEMKTQPCACFG